MIPLERESELLFYWQAETPEESSLERGEALSGEERTLVAGWDAKWLDGLYLRGKRRGAEK